MPVPSGGSVVFYRCVGEAEFADWKASGRLQPGPGTVEGKHLTSRADLALRWGRRFREQGWHGAEAVHILRIEIPADAAAGLFFLGESTDGIGPAWFATMEQLSHARVSEVTG